MKTFIAVFVAIMAAAVIISIAKDAKDAADAYNEFKYTCEHTYGGRMEGKHCIMQH